MKVDMHIHSTISDGSEDIETIIKTAETNNLDAIVIVEHDFLCPYNEKLQSDKVQVQVGIEISAAYQKTKTKAHILGYCIKKSELINTVTQRILYERNENSMKQIKILNNNGYQIDMDELSKANGLYIYKQHIMEHLVKNKQVSEMFGDFYQTTFKKNGICDFDIKYINVFEAIRSIKEAGGLAVLAHPGQQQNFWLIPKMVEFGLDGIELNHHANNEKDRFVIEKLAKRYNLFLTGGSDYHGQFSKEVVEIGDYLSHRSGVEMIF